MAHGGEEEREDEEDRCVECGEEGGNLCAEPDCDLPLCEACAEQGGGYCREHEEEAP